MAGSTEPAKKQRLVSVSYVRPRMAHLDLAILRSSLLAYDMAWRVAMVCHVPRGEWMASEIKDILQMCRNLLVKHHNIITDNEQRPQ
jgi:hypothetical protein